MLKDFIWKWRENQKYSAFQQNRKIVKSQQSQLQPNITDKTKIHRTPVRVDSYRGFSVSTFWE